MLKCVLLLMYIRYFLPFIIEVAFAKLNPIGLPKLNRGHTFPVKSLFTPKKKANAVKA